MVSLVNESKVQTNRTFADNINTEPDSLLPPAGVSNLLWQLSSPDERRPLLANQNNGNTAGFGDTPGFNASPADTLDGANLEAVTPFNAAVAPSQLSISDAGLEFITGHEGLRLELYNDPAGHATIGVGHLVHLGPIDGRASEAPFANGITRAEAMDLLLSLIHI